MMLMDVEKLDWDKDGGDWPHRQHSRFVTVQGVRWHYQDIPSDAGPDAPCALLIHGTGASSHSWRDMIPPLAKHLRLIVPDLPGHGFTRPPPGHPMSLPGMASSVGHLLAELEITPAAVIGHSAGAAIGLAGMITGRIDGGVLISFNGAFMPFKGIAAHVFAPIARLLVVNPFVPGFFARRADNDAAIERLVNQTGTGTLDEAGIRFYRRLLGSPAHVQAALKMMSSWDLSPLLRRMSEADFPVLLIVGEEDKAVPPGDAFALVEKLPKAKVEVQEGLGHLSHEEDPAASAALCLTFLRQHGLQS